MADVRLSIAGREYIVTCNDGEELRLQALGAMVDEKAREAGGPSGGLNESRLLLFAALLLADKLHVDILVVDEAHKIGDHQRGVILQDAIERVTRISDELRI